jgi:hypothetical protein
MFFVKNDSALGQEKFANGSAKNLSFTVAQTSHGFIEGDVLYRKSDGTYAKAIATTFGIPPTGASEVIGVVSKVKGADKFSLAVSGEISFVAANFESGLPTDGTVCYLSSLTAGKLATENRYLTKAVVIINSVSGSIAKGVVVLGRGDIFPNIAINEVFSDVSITTETVSVLNYTLTGTPQTVQLFFYDSSTGKREPLDASSHVRNVTSSSIVIDSNGMTFDSGDYLEVKLVYAPTGGSQIASPSTQYDSGWLDSSAVTELTHNLWDMEDIKALVVQEWDVTANRRRVIPAEGLVSEFDNTKIYLDWSGFSPSSTLKYKVVSSGNPLPQAIPVHVGGFTKFVGFGPGSYATLAAAIAEAASGDSILVNKSFTPTATTTLSQNDVKVQFMPGVSMNVSTDIDKVLVVSGSRCSVLDLNVNLTATGTLDSIVEISGDDCVVDRARLTVNNAGVTVTAAYNVTAAAEATQVYGQLRKTAGTITSAFTDAGSFTDYQITTNY